MALIPPFFLDCVVAIGFDFEAGERRYVATGFLIGDLAGTEGGGKQYRVFLVTNKHVLEGASAVWLRFNPDSDEPAREFPILLVDQARKPTWRVHSDPAIDIAVVLLNPVFLRENKIRFGYFQSDAHILKRTQAVKIGLSEGDGVFVLGFPMGLVGESRNYVIIRQGVIARIRDALCGNRKDFLIDTSIFPGNSGGPVVTRPELVSIQGTKPITTAYLIGVVSGYVPYKDVAISTQTKRPRMIFEENSGLAVVIPVDYVVDILSSFAVIPEQPQLPTMESSSQVLPPPVGEPGAMSELSPSELDEQ